MEGHPGVALVLECHDRNAGRVGLLYDPRVLNHQPPAGHPERPARVRETMAVLEASGILERLTRLPVTPATRSNWSASTRQPTWTSFKRSSPRAADIWMPGTPSPHPAPGRRPRSPPGPPSARWTP